MYIIYLKISSSVSGYLELFGGFQEVTSRLSAVYSEYFLHDVRYFLEQFVLSGRQNPDSVDFHREAYRTVAIVSETVSITSDYQNATVLFPISNDSLGSTPKKLYAIKTKSTYVCIFFYQTNCLGL